MAAVVTKQPKSLSNKFQDLEIDDKKEVKPEIKASTNNDGFTSYPLERFLGGVDRVVVSQQVEKIETASAWLSFGCCKVETENRFKVADMDSGKTLLMGDEESIWCLRNPCLCCDCICWCCHSDCASRRAFTMNLTAESLAGPLVIEMNRPCASDCLPCCLQSISVMDNTGFLGSVQQKAKCVFPCNICGLADRLFIIFPDDCDVQMKAVLIGSLLFFDYLFYEN